MAFHFTTASNLITSSQKFKYLKGQHLTAVQKNKKIQTLHIPLNYTGQCLSKTQTQTGTSVLVTSIF